MIKSRGFDVEIHHILTEDGYGLELHRLVNPYSNNDTKKPVLMRHGLGGSTSDFLINTPGYLHKDNSYIETVHSSNCKNESVSNSLGFVLSQFGYDVWLLNARGNYYSTFKTYKVDPKGNKLNCFFFFVLIEFFFSILQIQDFGSSA